MTQKEPESSTVEIDSDHDEATEDYFTALNAVDTENRIKDSL